MGISYSRSRGDRFRINRSNGGHDNESTTTTTVIAPLQPEPEMAPNNQEELSSHDVIEEHECEHSNQSDSSMDENNGNAVEEAEPDIAVNINVGVEDDLVEVSEMGPRPYNPSIGYVQQPQYPRAASAAQDYREHDVSKITSNDGVLDYSSTRAVLGHEQSRFRESQRLNSMRSLFRRELIGCKNTQRYIPQSTRLQNFGGEFLLRKLGSSTSSMSVVAEVRKLEDYLNSENFEAAANLAKEFFPNLTNGNGNSFRQSPESSLVEKEAFILAGGVKVIRRLFCDPKYVGRSISEQNDARALLSADVKEKYYELWTACLLLLSELITSLPGDIIDDSHLKDGFLVFLFTLLSHSELFDIVITILEEVLYIQSRRSGGKSMFFLGDIPNVYQLWRKFSGRELALFCRIFALVLTKPRERSELENEGNMVSINLIRTRRNRDNPDEAEDVVDKNHKLVLEDDTLIHRLLGMMNILNYSPDLKVGESYRIFSKFSWVADTLAMLGFSETVGWAEYDRLDVVARRRELLGVDPNDPAGRSACRLGTLASMLESFLRGLSRGENESNLGHIMQLIAAAQSSGIIAGNAPATNLPENDPDGNNNEAGQAVLENLGEVVEGNVDQAVNEEIVLEATNNSYVASLETERQNSMTPDKAANQLQYNALLMYSYQVEVYFVFCLLLSGKLRKKAQELCNKSKYSVALIGTETLHRYSWGVDAQRNSSRTEGNSEAAFRIQFLKFLKYFCENNETEKKKSSFASDFERSYVEMSRVSDLLNDHKHPSRRPKLLQCGLMTHLIQTYTEEPQDSKYRFWLAQVVEIVLKDSSIKEQIYYAAAPNVLQSIIADLLSPRGYCGNNFEVAFDLLAALCNANAFVVEMLICELGVDQLYDFLVVIKENLVASNLLLRNLLLIITSIYNTIYNKDFKCILSSKWLKIGHEAYSEDWVFIMKEIKEEIDQNGKLSPLDPPTNISSKKGKDVKRKTKDVVVPLKGLLSYFVNFFYTNEAHIIRSLIEEIDFQVVSNENMCCISSAILFLMCSKDRDYLTKTIQSLRTLNSGAELSKDFFRNFRQLCWFWKEYYSHCEEDRFALEMKTGVSFEAWIDMYNLLCSDDGSAFSLVASPVLVPKSPYHCAPTHIYSC